MEVQLLFGVAYNSFSLLVMKLYVPRENNTFENLIIINSSHLTPSHAILPIPRYLFHPTTLHYADPLASCDPLPVELDALLLFLAAICQAGIAALPAGAPVLNGLLRP